KEIEDFVNSQISEQETTVSTSELKDLTEEDKAKFKDRIINAVKKNNLNIERFKLFTLDRTTSLIFGGYKPKVILPERLSIDKVSGLIEITNERIPSKIPAELMEILLNNINNDIIPEIEFKENFILNYYNITEENNFYTLKSEELKEKDAVNLSKVLYASLHNIVLNYYGLTVIKEENPPSDTGETAKEKEIYILNSGISEEEKNKLLELFKLFNLEQNSYPREARSITNKEIQKAIEASTSASVGGKLFTNEELIDYKYMDIYIPIGDLITKARVELPNSRQQYNSLLRLVIIAGSIIIIAHIGFIIIAYVILVSPMKSANTALEGQNKELEEANKIFIEQLEVAKQVQEAILPEKSAIPSTGVDIGTVFDSLEEVSGDYLDVIEIDAEHVGILVVDVSGHGIPSALVTTMAKVSFNSHSNTYKTDTASIFNSVNKDLCKATGESDYYCTAVMCVVNIRTYDVYYSTGGHPKYLIYKVNAPEKINKDDYEKQLVKVIENEEDKLFINKVYKKENPDKKKSGYIIKSNSELKQVLNEYDNLHTIEELKQKIKKIMDSIYFIQEYATRGFMIGAAEFARYQMDTTQLDKGDKLIIFSDGVIEAEGPGGTMYEYDRFKKLIINNKNLSSQELSDLIHKDVIDFRGDTPATDDISIIVLEATNEPEREETKEEMEEVEEKGEIPEKKETKDKEKKEVDMFNSIEIDDIIEEVTIE
ncbi:MAG: PP2C family protein-serine/threonine phosphatase, partial [Spirochaetota bacterium]